MPLQSGPALSSAFQYLGVTLQAQILLMVDLLLKHKLTVAQRGVLENVVITKVCVIIMCLQVLACLQSMYFIEQAVLDVRGGKVFDDASYHTDASVRTQAIVIQAIVHQNWLRLRAFWLSCFTALPNP